MSLQKQLDQSGVMITALRQLAVDIQSQDGIANAVCADAALMIEEFVTVLREALK